MKPGLRVPAQTHIHTHAHTFSTENGTSGGKNPNFYDHCLISSRMMTNPSGSAYSLMESHIIVFRQGSSRHCTSNSTCIAELPRRRTHLGTTCAKTVPLQVVAGLSCQLLLCHLDPCFPTGHCSEWDANQTSQMAHLRRQEQRRVYPIDLTTVSSDQVWKHVKEMPKI